MWLFIDLFWFIFLLNCFSIEVLDDHIQIAALIPTTNDINILSVNTSKFGRSVESLLYQLVLNVYSYTLVIRIQVEGIM